MTDNNEGNTDIEIRKADYIKIPVGLLALLWQAIMNDTKEIQVKYGAPILDLLKNGELS